MFNIQGSELIFLLLIALLVLGPEKLPDAIRKFTKTYAEFKKVAGGFQGELRQVLDEPMRELRGTADMLRQAATFDPEAEVVAASANDTDESPARPTPMISEIAPRPTPEKRDNTLNFGNAAARREQGAIRREQPGPAPAPTAETDEDAAG